jgi:hypothetical protein
MLADILATASSDQLYLIAVAVAGPLLLFFLQRQSLRSDRMIEMNAQMKEKELEWARQDVVAARAEAVAVRATKAAEAVHEQQSKQVEQAETAAVLLKENNEAVTRAAVETHGQLKIIHTLVNSSLTSAKTSELAALRAQLVLMKELVDQRRQGGIEPNPETLRHIAEVETLVHALAVELAERSGQQEIADQQIIDIAVETGIAPTPATPAEETKEAT